MADLLSRVVPGYQEAMIVMTACRLGLFEAVSRGEDDAASLAATLGLETGAAGVLLDALAALGLLRKRRGRYGLSRLSSEKLVRGRPSYLGDLVLHQERMLRLWSRLEGIVRGTVPRGGAVAEGEDGEAVREFVLAMEANAQRNGRRVAAAVDLKGVRRLLDLGGGPGTYSRHFLARRPALRATVMDLPQVVGAARSLGFGGPRLSWRPGDFLRAGLGRGWDLIWASNVFHSLGSEDSLRLLKRCRLALGPGGRLLVHDFFLEKGRTRPRRAAVFAVHMLAVTPAGRVYTRAEFAGLMDEAGFDSVLVKDLGSSLVLSGRRPPGSRR